MVNGLSYASSIFHSEICLVALSKLAPTRTIFWPLFWYSCAYVGGAGVIALFLGIWVGVRFASSTGWLKEVVGFCNVVPDLMMAMTLQLLVIWVYKRTGVLLANVMTIEQEEAVLYATVKLGVVKAADLSSFMPSLNANQCTYQIKKLVERKMLQPLQANARQYTIGFDSNYIMRGVIHALSAEGFISAPLTGVDNKK